MALEKHDYANPDDDEEGVEIVIEDDTPEEDRGREPMPEEIVQALEDDDFSKYEGEVKNRMSQLKKVWHDERRQKEAAFREQQEAINATKALLEENRRLKSTLTEGEREYIQTVQVASKLAMDAAKRNLLEAHDSGDAERIIEAQQTFNEATIKNERAANFKPALQQDENSVEQQHIKPKLDPKTQTWMTKNAWFGQSERMTHTAMRYHQDLESRFGASYIGSDEYFNDIDHKMRQEFPDYFGDTGRKSNGTQTVRKPAAVVAPATRSTSPKRVYLKESQLRLAKKMGLTPEQYAMELQLTGDN